MRLLSRGSFSVLLHFCVAHLFVHIRQVTILVVLRGFAIRQFVGQLVEHVSVVHLVEVGVQLRQGSQLKGYLWSLTKECPEKLTKLMINQSL